MRDLQKCLVAVKRCIYRFKQTIWLDMFFGCQKPVFYVGVGLNTLILTLICDSSHKGVVTHTWADTFNMSHVMFDKAVLYEVLISALTHWGWVMDICVSKLTSIGSDNGMSPGQHPVIIWTNDGMLSIGPLGTNFSEILIEIYTFSLKKMHLKMSSARMSAILSWP